VGKEPRKENIKKISQPQFGALKICPKRTIIVTASYETPPNHPG